MKDVDNSFRRNFYLGVLLIAFYFLLSNIRELYSGMGNFIGILNPFILGFAIAYILNIPMKLIEDKFLSLFMKSSSSRKFKRPIAIILTFILLIGFIIMVILFVVPEFLSNITALVNNIPDYISGFEGTFSSFLEDFPISPEIINDVSSKILNAWKEWLTIGGQVITSSLTSLITTTINITSGFINFILSIIFAIYMLASKEKLIVQLKKLTVAFLPKNISNRILYIGRISNVTFSKFIGGQCTEAVILGVLCFIGMSLLRIPYALVVSVLVGVTALIPIFGAFIGAVPSVILILLIDPTKALWFIIFILCLQQFEGNVIYPKVVGNSVGISPILVMLAMLVGGQTLGLLGMLIGIPVFSVAYQLIKDRTHKRLTKIKHSNLNNENSDIDFLSKIENQIDKKEEERTKTTNDKTNIISKFNSKTSNKKNKNNKK